MRLVTDENVLNDLVATVQKYVGPHRPSDYSLDVMADAIQQDDDWYYVVVRPSGNDVRSYDYNARLVEAEFDLQEKEKLKVLLVPALPD